MNQTLSEDSLFHIVIGAGPMVKFVLLILLAASVISWAIIIYKVRHLRRIEAEGAAFYDLFWGKKQFNQMLTLCKTYKATPLAAIFMAAYNEIAGQAKGQGQEQARPETVRLDRDDIDRLQRILRKTGSAEAAKLEYAVGFLATTGNTAPFIGLFGTVWGIMDSFRSIGIKGAASLAVVAPGISEALVATAMGLVAAIPAVVGYNHIITMLGRINTQMESFGSDLLNVIEKQSSK